MTIEESKALLKKAGLRITEARLMLIRLLVDSDGPKLVEEFHKLLRRCGNKCDLATVYRNLLKLEKSGIVGRIEFDDHRTRFEISLGERHHHHVICRKCKGVECLPLCIPKALTRAVVDRGYNHVSHSLEFFGICRRCAA